MIFCQRSTRNIRNLLKIFNDYRVAYQKIINKQKSKFYAGSILKARHWMISNLIGFNSGSIPFNHLGCPIFVGRSKAIYFPPIADKKGSLLSIMRRVQLVKYIIHGMLVYSFHIYLWPHKKFIMANGDFLEVLWTLINLWHILSHKSHCPNSLWNWILYTEF
jgi:hypothetical protein